jgi:RHS repeat-associated protein
VATGDDPNLYGIVAYAHAHGIDQPVGILKKIPNGSWAYVTPYTNWRGEWSYGTFANGNLCLAFGATCPNWPGATQTADGSSQGTVPPTYTVWWGSLIRDRADATGLQYLRNRYYDPKTGRFTQQDPIGLAGGMNLYGFAAGDPVNFSDPFGLRAQDDDERDNTGQRAHGAFRNWLRAKADQAVRALAGLNALFNPMADLMGTVSGRDPGTGGQLSGGDRAVLAVGMLLGPGGDALKYWHKATFASEAASAAYHLRTHAPGRTLEQYTTDAIDFYRQNRGRGVARTARDGSDAILIRTKGGPGGWFTPDGRVITFWYR